MKKSYKRLIALVLMVALSLTTLALGTFAYRTRNYDSRINGYNSDVQRYEHGSLNSLYRIGLGVSGNDTKYSLGGLAVNPGEEVRIPLTADMFSYKDGYNPVPGQAVSLRDLRYSQVTVRTLVQSGADALEYVQLDRDVFPTNYFTSEAGIGHGTGRTAYISIKFAETLREVDGVEFTYQIYMTVNGEIIPGLSVDVSGILQNPEVDINENTTAINIDDGSVAVSSGRSEAPVEFDLGQGVTVKRKTYDNRKYYGRAGVKHASEPGLEFSWPEAYPSVQAAYILQTVNMRYGFSRVKIDPQHPDISTFHVYGEDMRYYGTTDDWLVYSDIYFLSSELIESFTTEEYLDNLQNEPISRKVTVGEFEELEEMDEAELLAAERRAKDEKALIAYNAEAKAEVRRKENKELDNNINQTNLNKSESTTTISTVIDTKGQDQVYYAPPRSVTGADTSPNMAALKNA